MLIWILLRKFFLVWLSIVGPGNVRELANVIEKMVVFSKGHNPKVTTANLPSEIREHYKEVEKVEIAVGTSLEKAEKLLISATLQFCKGNKSKAAELLGIGRKTLYKKFSDTT